MDRKTVEDYILSLAGAQLDYPFGKEVAVYKLNGEMFALLEEGREPLRISLRCDPELAKVLRDKYDEVMPGYNLNKNKWNTMVLTGQLGWPEVQGLIRHSYELINNSV